MNQRYRSLLHLLLVCSLAFSVWGASPVRINEFLASNSGGLADEDGDFSDWIELFNSSNQPVNLSGWTLADSTTNPAQWEFPSITIPANGYLVIFASGKNRISPRLHTNFQLQEAGEYLALLQPDGQIASEFAPAYPSQRKDVSYGVDKTGALVFFSSPTPGGLNGGGVLDFVKDTKFSQDRGFFDAAFDLVISTATDGATIRYTTNGVPPTATSGFVYSGPIHIAGTTVVRAAAFKTGLQPSNVDTQTYIFLEDVIRQSPTGSAPPGWPSSWGGNTVDYGMDPAVVNDARYKDTIKSDLKSIPTFSIVMNLSDLFNSSTGIYANPGQDGRDWERPCSLELIYPNGTKGFQINAGIRIRGGFSRSTGNPKHAFRFFFREEYGASKLNYPVFGKDAASSFDKFDIRTFQNYSWSFQGDGNGVFLRDQFSRDTQLAMGYNAERGDFYHLYINGQYWGLYNTAERPEASFAESYFGGKREEYDTVKVDTGGYVIFATDGNMAAWTSLYNAAKAGLSTQAAYQKIQGNNPDGTPNLAFPVLIDVPNLIDYMLVIIYTGNKDAPISNFLGDASPNNWYGIRNTNITSRMGFKFFAHDSEHTLLPWDLNINRIGPFSAGDTSVTKSSPQYIFKQLSANPEFKLLVADHIQRHFFNGGLLTREANTARFVKRKAEIDRAVVGESARWGDAKRSTPFTRDTDWIGAINNVVNNFFPQRSQIVLNQLKASGYYPNVAAPALNQHGGNVEPAFPLSMSAPAGQIYYTFDGSDPRMTGGAVSAKARLYNAPVVLNENVRLKARALSSGTWSALEEADFTIIRDFRDLVITELMYHPAALTNAASDDLEFVEMKNTGSETLDLSGIRFTNGISYTFPNGSKLSPGGFVVLASNPSAFALRYPNVRVDGAFTNNLSNSGETISLVHAAGAVIAEFTYSDKAPWPSTPDGGGFSLVLKRADSTVDYSDPSNWRASAAVGGSPGADDPPVDIPAILVNEALTHTDLPAKDFIELYNPSTLAADIGGWYLTDDLKVPKKFRIPDGTTIPGGGYLVFTEDDFNKTPGVEPSFTLSSHGEQVYLFSATADGTLSGYSQGFAFGGAENGASFGRYTNSVGEVLYPAQISQTPRNVNSGPRVGPVVINEILYAPAPGGDEFIELKNITASPVKLYDSANPTNTWRVDGLNYHFPQGVEIPANGLLVVSGIDPDLFRQHHHLPSQIQVHGPFSGTLQDNGELIELVRPDTPDIETNGSVFIPYIVVDAVRYSSGNPWPTNSNGNGSSIERLSVTAFGNDPANWRSSPGTPSPGLENNGNRLPVVDAGADQQLVSAAFPVAVNLTGTATDDGQPNPPGALTYTWTVVSGPGNIQLQNSNQRTVTASLPGTGVYILRFTANDGEFSVSDDVAVSVSRPLANQDFIPRNSVWRYLDDGSDQGTAWRATEFNDSGWKSGPAVLGYGDPVATTLAYGPNSSSKYPTTYFRRSFNLNGARSVVTMLARLQRDDGAVVYINGTEVFRSNMPEGNINYQTLASDVVGGSDETALFDYPVDPSVLREGLNVVAVELHQQNGSSSDLQFDLQLSGEVNASNKLPTATAGPDLAITLPAAANLNGTAGDDGLPNPPGVFNSTWSMVSGPGSVSFADANSLQTTASFSSGGVYLLRLTVTDGELTVTDDVQVNVAGGVDPYQAWREDHFTPAELNDPKISGDDADADGDGFTNQQEYVAGTDPRNRNSYLQIVEAESEGADFVLRFEAVGDKSYTIIGRDEANGGDWERVIDLSPQGTTKTVEIVDPMAQTQKRKFYRVVTPQLPPR